jgi:hypothetical protein
VFCRRSIRATSARSPLDGLRWGGLFELARARSTSATALAMAVIDRARRRRSSAPALEAIAQGRETEPGSLITQVFSHHAHERACRRSFKRIDLAIDERARHRRASACRV